MNHFYLLRRIFAACVVLLAAMLLSLSPAKLGAQDPNNFLAAADGDPQKAVFVDGDGKVGIGTEEPEHQLDVTGRMRVLDGSDGQAPGIWFYDRQNPLASTFVGMTEEGNLGLFGEWKSTDITRTNWGLVMTPGTGNIGIGVPPNYDYRLDVAAHMRLQGRSPQLRFEDPETNQVAEIGLRHGDDIFGFFALTGGVSNAPRMLVMNTTNGNVGIGTRKPEAKLDVAGTTRTAVLQITGGSDLAELFDVTGNDTIEPGLVVAIDPNYPGKLHLATQAYDRMVAGVVSGAGGIHTGLTLHQQDSDVAGNQAVALTGRVYVWADATNGAIQPGDLLTTSDTPGHAMKVADYERAQGAILGKAMSRLEEGTGLVLILVTLQ